MTRHVHVVCSCSVWRPVAQASTAAGSAHNLSPLLQQRTDSIFCFRANSVQWTHTSSQFLSFQMCRNCLFLYYRNVFFFFSAQTFNVDKHESSTALTSLWPISCSSNSPTVFLQTLRIQRMPACVFRHKPVRLCASILLGFQTSTMNYFCVILCVCIHVHAFVHVHI